MFFVFVFFCLFFVGLSAASRRAQINKAKKMVNRSQLYPRYNGTWDRYWNKFLPKGTCCVCKTENVTVMRLSCGHSLCLEDLHGYLESALGDISMFPVKCPMHYENCGGSVDSKIAKRVLTEPQYVRFNEFSDRAHFGDGMF
jgi:hypothetical protein